MYVISVLRMIRLRQGGFRNYDCKDNAPVKLFLRFYGNQVKHAYVLF